MNKDQKEQLKKQVESLGLKVSKVHNVISNGTKIRLDRGQGKKWTSEKRMIAVLIEVDED